MIVIFLNITIMYNNLEVIDAKCNDLINDFRSFSIEDYDDELYNLMIQIRVAHRCMTNADTPPHIIQLFRNILIKIKEITIISDGNTQCLSTPPRSP